MSTIHANPSVEEVEALSPADFIIYLNSKKAALFLNDNHINAFASQEVAGSDFLYLTKQELTDPPYRFNNGPANRIIQLISQLNNQKQAVATGVNTGLVHIFVDNSNLYVEGKYTVGAQEKIYETKTVEKDTKNENEKPKYFYMKQLNIDYGYLLTTILSERKLGSDPVIVGSRPPPDDTLWDGIKELGYNVSVYDRNFENKEKCVDVKLGICMIKTLLETRNRGVLVLVAGDGDYEPVLEEFLKAGWKVEIRFWGSAISNHLKEPEITRKNKELKVIFKPLDNEYRYFTYAFGPEPTQKKKVLVIEHDKNRIWKSEKIMKCYIELQLQSFCWWCKVDNHTLELYFDDNSQLVRAERWIMNNFSGVYVWQKQQKRDELPN